jgi:SAM-dependent methyltransferase
METVDQVLTALNYVPRSPWAWSNFLPTVKSLIEIRGYSSVMEIGGGRFPSFKQNEAEAMGLRYTSNDISQAELSLAPRWVDTACFDVQTNNPAEFAGHEDRYDLIYSQMVMEHVPSYRRAYRNMAALLKPGGLAIAFHPTLYALPYVVNRIVPESVSAPILRLVSPDRTRDCVPKHPAFYSGCVISKTVRDTIRDIGFSEVQQVPFYSHHYYDRIPLVRDIHYRFSDMAAALKLTALSSFCYTVASK